MLSDCIIQTQVQPGKSTAEQNLFALDLLSLSGVATVRFKVLKGCQCKNSRSEQACYLLGETVGISWCFTRLFYIQNNDIYAKPKSHDKVSDSLSLTLFPVKKCFLCACQQRFQLLCSVCFYRFQKDLPFFFLLCFLHSFS